MNIKTYDYVSKPDLNVEKLISSLVKIKDSIVLFQTCCHNPSGVDIKNDIWDIIAKIIKDNKNILILDNAYQGLVSGDVDKDNYCIKKFIQYEIPLLIC